MHMIWHSIYNNGFLLFTLNDARNIFMQFSIPTLADHVFSSLYGKNYLYVDLRKCSWHGDQFGLVRCHPFGVYCPNLHLFYNHISPLGFLHDAAKYEFDNVNPSGFIVLIYIFAIIISALRAFYMTPQNMSLTMSPFRGLFLLIYIITIIISALRAFYMTPQNMSLTMSPFR